MSKFKIGDKVKVIKNINDSFYDKYIGKVCTISDTAEFGNYLPFKNGSWWEDEELELYGPMKDSMVVVDTGVSKPSNPKDALGVKKVPMSVLPSNVVQEVALGMFEGAVKYGRHNYRVVGVRASVYYDATMRHLMQWWEGEDIDPDSGLSHITKAISSLVVLRDAMLQDKLTDDRPPKTQNQDFTRDNNKKVEDILNKYPEVVEPYTEENKK